MPQFLLEKAVLHGDCKVVVARNCKSSAEIVDKLGFYAGMIRHSRQYDGQAKVGADKWVKAHVALETAINEEETRNARANDAADVAAKAAVERHLAMRWMHRRRAEAQHKLHSIVGSAIVRIGAIWFDGTEGSA